MQPEVAAVITATANVEENHMQLFNMLGIVTSLMLAPVLQAAEPPADDARIPFADMGGIQDWRAADDDTLFIQGRSDQWYRAELMSPCIGLDFANTIGFVVEPVGSFNEFSSIVVEGRQCHLASLVEIAGPPAARDRSGTEAAERTAAADAAESSDGGAADEPDSARIAFADLGGIRDWRAVDDDTLYVQGRGDEWYRAEIMGGCPGLESEVAIGFVLEPLGAFDRFSSILVDGWECQLRSFVESAPPPGASSGPGRG